VKQFFPIFLFFLYSCTTSVKEFSFQTGDLLFQVGKSSELNEAITEVTSGERDIHYTHIGIVFVENDTIFVIEAIPPEVSKTLLDTFLSRLANWEEKPLVAVKHGVENSHTWLHIHVLFGIIFIVASIYHVVYNWKAFKNYLLGKK